MQHNISSILFFFYLSFCKCNSQTTRLFYNNVCPAHRILFFYNSAQCFARLIQINVNSYFSNTNPISCCPVVQLLYMNM